MQSDPSGGALFALAAVTEVGVLTIQLLLLQGERQHVKTTNKSRDFMMQLLGRDQCRGV